MANLDGKVLCTKNEEFDSGACCGDSGGPVVVNRFLVGIISNSLSCGVGHPDIHTNVYEHLDWIRSEGQKSLL